MRKKHWMRMMKGEIGEYMLRNNEHSLGWKEERKDARVLER